MHPCKPFLFAAMQVYLISSTSISAERFEFQKTQLASLGLKFDLIDAVVPASLSIPLSDHYWLRWQRPLRDVECAILQSHQHAWRYIAESSQPAMVIEDDVLLAKHVAAFLESVSQGLDARIIILETRGRKKLLSRSSENLSSLRLLHQNRSGAAAYILWPTAARELLEMTAKRGILADAALCRLKGYGVYQAKPPLALQADCCFRYDLIPPIPLKSSVLSVAKPNKKQYSLLLRLRWATIRAFAQISMARTFILHGANSEYVELRPQDSDFED